MNNSLDEKLDAFLDDQLLIEQSERFVIDSMEKADWAVRKIAKYKASVAAAEKLAQDRIKQINQWLAKETEESQNQINFFESLLRPFAEQQIKPTDKKRSLKLPSGTFGFTKSQPKFNRDEDKLLAWVKENAVSFVETKESVRWGDLKGTLEIKGDKMLTADGEIVPGIKVEEVPDKFYIKGVE